MELKDVMNSLYRSKEDLATEMEGMRELVDMPAMWVVNRMVSLFPDCVMDVNEINVLQGIDDLMQYDFLRFRLEKRTKTFTPWIKPDKPPEDVELVQEYYNYSTAKAIEALELLTPEQLQIIRDSYFEGGVVKEKKRKKKDDV